MLAPQRLRQNDQTEEEFAAASPAARTQKRHAGSEGAEQAADRQTDDEARRYAVGAKQNVPRAADVGEEQALATT